MYGLVGDIKLFHRSIFFLQVGFFMLMWKNVT